MWVCRKHVCQCPSRQTAKQPTKQASEQNKRRDKTKLQQQLACAASSVTTHPWHPSTPPCALQYKNNNQRTTAAAELLLLHGQQHTTKQLYRKHLTYKAMTLPTKQVQL